MIKIFKVFVEDDTPPIHLLNDVNYIVGEGMMNGEKVFMMERKKEEKKKIYTTTDGELPLTVKKDEIVDETKSK